MAMPTAPTAESICTEAYRHFRIASPTGSQVDRAVDHAMESVKRDIMALGKQWRPLLTTAYAQTVQGVSHYDNPADFEINKTVGLMTSIGTGSLSAVESASAVTLDASEDAKSYEAIGSWLYITSGAGIDQSAQIKSYSETTKACGLVAAFDTTPTATNGYMLCRSIADLRYIPPELYDRMPYPGTSAAPQVYTDVPNDGAGELALYPVPDDAYGIRRRYYADLLRVDVSSTLYAALLRRWAGVFFRGVYAWILMDEDDNRAQAEAQKYHELLQVTFLQDHDGLPAGTQKIQSKQAER